MLASRGGVVQKPAAATPVEGFIGRGIFVNSMLSGKLLDRVRRQGHAILVPARPLQKTRSDCGKVASAAGAGAGARDEGSICAPEAKTPYLPAHIQTVRLAGGRNVLWIEFAAPSMLGLLGPRAH
jgi:hypothetical protein